jgi:hypothetical protein
MIRLKALRAALPVVAALAFAACSDSATAPTARALDITPSAAVIGGPNLADFKSFAGQLWVCPDTPGPGQGFFFAWKIVDNATNTIVASGTVSKASAQQCLLLGTVPTGTPGRYTATVKEDPGAAFKVNAITASYGANFPIAPPTPTVNVPKRTISSLMTHDFGVLFTFIH